MGSDMWTVTREIEGANTDIANIQGNSVLKSCTGRVSVVML